MSAPSAVRPSGQSLPGFASGDFGLAAGDVGFASGDVGFATGDLAFIFASAFAFVLVLMNDDIAPPRDVPVRSMTCAAASRAFTSARIDSGSGSGSVFTSIIPFPLTHTICFSGGAGHAGLPVLAVLGTAPSAEARAPPPTRATPAGVGRRARDPGGQHEDARALVRVEERARAGARRRGSSQRVSPVAVLR